MYNTKQIADDFSRAAMHYNKFAQMQAEIVTDLKSWMSPHEINGKFLDAGSGTGFALEKNWTALDIAQGMCEQTCSTNHSVCADMQQIPFVDNVFDGVFTSLSSQWVPKLSLFLAEANRITKKNGAIYFATLVHNTLNELHHAYQRSGLISPVLQFKTVEVIERDFVTSGWNIEKIDSHTMTRSHDNLLELLREIKGLGAQSKDGSAYKMKGMGWLRLLEKNYSAKQNQRTLSSWHVIKIKAIKR